MLLDPEDGGAALVDALNAQAQGLSAAEIVALALRTFAGRIAAVSSFGADSAVLLHILASQDRTLPVLFLDTGKHFQETLTYRDELVRDFGLTDLRSITPLADAVASSDADGRLHERNADACCAIRKVEPMVRAVAPFAAWFTGRKRFQTDARGSLPIFESVGPRVRINPLAAWTAADIRAHAEENGLRANPLVAYGYLSIGCFPCTSVVAAGGSERDGRWAGSAKVECGIHLTGLKDSLAVIGAQTTSGPAGPKLWTERGFLADEWRHHAEGELPDGRLILPLPDYLELDAAFRQANANRLGVLVRPADDLATLLPYLDDLPLVALAFPAFNDGRSYSRAALLRTRHGFTGQLRAVGEVLIDQIPLMLRTGFDTFEVTNETALRRLGEGRLGGIDFRYQPSTRREPAGPAYSWRRLPARAG